MPILGLVPLVAHPQNLGCPLHNLVGYIRIRERYCSKSDAKDADRVKAKRHWHTIKDDVPPCLPDETTLKRFNLSCPQNACVRSKTKGGHRLEVLLCSLFRCGAISHGSKLRVRFGFPK